MSERKMLSAEDMDHVRKAAAHPSPGMDLIRTLVGHIDAIEADRTELREALRGLLREEPNIYEGRLEASLYVSVDALEAAQAALERKP